MVCITNLFNFTDKLLIMKLTLKHEELSENELMATLKHALAISRRPLLEDGILFIAWGIVFSLGFGFKYYESVKLTSRLMRNTFDVLSILSALALIGLTIYFLFFRNRKVRSYEAIPTRMVWIGIIIAHNLNVVVTNNFFDQVNFSMLHPLQMILIGFALFVTGGIYRYYMLSVSGVLMWIAALVCARYELTDQFLVRSIADFVCFIIPGILMYMQSKKTAHV